VSLFRAKTVQQRPLLPREVKQTSTINMHHMLPLRCQQSVVWYAKHINTQSYIRTNVIVLSLQSSYLKHVILCCGRSSASLMSSSIPVNSDSLGSVSIINSSTYTVNNRLQCLLALVIAHDAVRRACHKVDQLAGITSGVRQKRQGQACING